MKGSSATSRHRRGSGNLWAGGILAPPLASAIYAAAPAPAEACTTRTLCVRYLLSLTDGDTGDYVGLDADPYVPARGAHVIIVRAYPEPALDGYLSVEATGNLDAGCIEFESQFAAGQQGDHRSPGGARLRHESQ